MFRNREKFNKLWTIHDEILKTSFQKLLYNMINAHYLNEVKLQDIKYIVELLKQSTYIICLLHLYIYIF